MFLAMCCEIYVDVSCLFIDFCDVFAISSKNSCFKQEQDNCNDCLFGVLFVHSWPCLHKWLETRPNRQVCPVCKAAISKEKVVPLYGRGNTRQEDPRDKVPPRPAGQRTEPEAGSSFPGIHLHTCRVYIQRYKTVSVRITVKENIYSWAKL